MRSSARVIALFTLVFCCGVVSQYGFCDQDPCADGGCLGPNAPVLVDTNENGKPDPGIDLEITIDVGPTGVVIGSPWHCDPVGTENVVTFLEPDVKRGGKIVTVERFIDNGILQRAEIAPEGFLEGRPTKVKFVELQPGRPPITGWGELQDRDGDGFHERGVIAREIQGGAIKIELGFIGADVNGDGQPDYMSIPWAQSDLVGVAVGDDCGPIWTISEDPQVWVPLVDTDQDGAPDSIVADLDGDFQADGSFFWTPRLAMEAARGVPHVPGDRSERPVSPIAQMGLGAILLGLAIGGWSTLRRREVIG